MWKLMSRAFQWCILRGGQHLVEVSQNEDFLQKNCLQNSFLGGHKSGSKFQTFDQISQFWPNLTLSTKFHTLLQCFHNVIGPQISQFLLKRPSLIHTLKPYYSYCFLVGSDTVSLRQLFPNWTLSHDMPQPYIHFGDADQEKIMNDFANILSP